MSNVTPLKKVTAPNVFGSIIEHLRELSADDEGNYTRLKKGAQIELYDLIGRCDGIKTGKSQFGDWTMFTGQFEAVNLVTGEVFMGPSAAFPEPIQTMLVDALGEHNELDIGGRFVVTVKDPELKSETSYEYAFKPITEVKPSSALDHLRKARESFVAGLPAPKVAALPGKTEPAAPEKAAPEKKTVKK